MVTKKPMKAKTMEKLIIPFVVLLIGLFIYITYQDLYRLFTKFFLIGLKKLLNRGDADAQRNLAVWKRPAPTTVKVSATR